MSARDETSVSGNLSRGRAIVSLEEWQVVSCPTTFPELPDRPSSSRFVRCPKIVRCFRTVDGQRFTILVVGLNTPIKTHLFPSTVMETLTMDRETPMNEQKNETSETDAANEKPARISEFSNPARDTPYVYTHTARTSHASLPLRTPRDLYVRFFSAFYDRTDRVHGPPHFSRGAFGTT